VGIVLQQAGLPGAAVEEYARAAHLEAGNRVYPLNQLQALIDAGMHEAAASLASALEPDFTDSERFWELFTRSLKARGDVRASLVAPSADMPWHPPIQRWRWTSLRPMRPWASVRRRRRSQRSGRPLMPAPACPQRTGAPLHERGRLGGAEALYRQAVEQAPGDSVLCANLLNALLRQDRVDEACARGLEWLGKGAAPRPYFLARLGQAFHMKGDHLRAWAIVTARWR
jgi:predicted Zn-dependent protease